MNNDIEIRRIFLDSDAEEIRKLQQNAPEFQLHYPKHNEWLKMALEEVVSGKRFAFGIWKSVFDGQGKPVVSLVGSIILKKEGYSHAMQLKNLYVKPDERDHHYGRRLFDAVEQFCIKRGTIAIETEVPTEEKRTIDFLNHREFVIHDVIESPYRKGDRIYKMKKDLPRKYTGDPFDLFDLSCWLFETGFDFRIIDPKLQSNLQFVAEPKFEFEKAKGSDIMHIRGSAMVVDGLARERSIDDFHKKNKEHLLAVIAREFESSAKTFCRKHRVFTLDQATIETELRNAFAIEIPAFRKENVGGMIVSMNSKYFSNLVSNNIPKTFFKGGPIGKYSKQGDQVLFYVEQSPNSGEGGVRAYAEVLKCEIGTPVEIWDRFKDKTPIFPKEDYDIWRADKVEVIALTVSNVSLIQPIPYDRINELITPTPFDNERLGHFYLSGEDIARFLKNRQNINSTEMSITQGVSQIMDPVTVVTTITAGLNMIDKFRRLVIDLKGDIEKTPSLEVKQSENKIEIRQDNRVDQEINTQEITMSFWDDTRYRALYSRAETSWKQYNALYSRLPKLSVDEKVRIEAKMDEMKAELCADLSEMISIYEATLGVSLEKYYSLSLICK